MPVRLHLSFGLRVKILSLGLAVVVVVSLDPHNSQEATLQLDMPTLGLGWQDVMETHDEVTGQTFWWGERPYVRLDPFYEPAHILTVRRG